MNFQACKGCTFPRVPTWGSLKNKLWILLLLAKGFLRLKSAQESRTLFCGAIVCRRLFLLQTQGVEKNRKEEKKKIEDIIPH